MPLVIKKEKAKAVETKTLKSKSQVISEDVKEEALNLPSEVVSLEPSNGPWCEVQVDVSYTHNLGNFQSARVGVSLKVPCLFPEVDGAFDYAKEWADNRLTAMIDELQS